MTNKNKLSFKINDTTYHWDHQYITGVEIRTLGAIPSDEKLFLEIKRPWVDEPVFDDSSIDLARPGLERFYSKKDDPIDFQIIVNGRPKQWNDRIITYEQVSSLAYLDFNPNQITIYTVNFIDGPEQNLSGSMVAGDKVFVKQKMIFNVTATNRS